MERKKLWILGGLGAIIVVLAIFLGIPEIRKSVIRYSQVYRELIGEEPSVKERVARGRLEKIGQGDDEIGVLYLKGAPYEMGFQHGELLKEDVKSCIEGILDYCYRYAEEQGLDRSGSDFFLDEAYRKMEPYIPKDYREEMMGLADGSGVPLKMIHRIHAVPGLDETSCSALAAFGKATLDGNLYQLRILDYSLEFGVQNYPTISVYQPNEGNPFVSIGWAGFIGVLSGMNEEGVAVSQMGGGNPKDESPWIPDSPPEETISGIPMIFLLKKVLQYSENVSEALGILKSAERTNYYAYIVGDGIIDGKEPQVRGAFSTKRFFKVHRDNDPHYPIPALADIVYCSHYNEKCYELLREYYGRIDPSLIVEKINPAIAMDSNLQCVVYDPTNLRFWVANAESKSRACDQDYALFDFGKALEALDSH